MTVLLCSLMHFVGSFCASLVLGEVSELTFSIMSTMKRVVIILSAVFYFGNAVTAQSVAGMVLAVRCEPLGYFQNEVLWQTDL